ncbi:MAG TPA: PAS domain S-box protein [Myxococcaceae bacterium]|nr:PAS domain S-box protein [Myxococcaceae bacterium]
MSARAKVLLLPAGAAVRQRVVGALAGSGFELSQGPAEADVDAAVVDLTVPGGAEALASLRAGPSGAALPVVVLLRLGGPSRPETIEGADAVLDIAQVEAELSWRLTSARGRRAAELSSAEGRRSLAFLLELTARYAETADVDALLHDVTRSLAEALDIVRASLVVADGDTGVVVAASDDPGMKDLRIDLSLYPEVREALRTGAPVTVADAPSHPLLEGVHPRVSAAGVRAIAALPLLVQGVVTGVFLVRGSDRRPAFTAAEVEFLATVAHATAIALRNARLVQSVRGQTELEKVARIAAEQRAAALQRYAAYFAHVSDGIAVLDGRGRVLSLNPAGAALLDVEAEAAQGAPLHTLTRGAGEPALRELLDAVASGHPLAPVDLTLHTRAGRPLTLSFSGAPLHEGEAVSILSFRDVTAPRRIAEELRHTKEFLEKLIDSSVDAIIAADIHGRIILFNSGAEALTGYSAAEAMAALEVRRLYPEGMARMLMERLRSDEFGGRGRLAASRVEVVTRSGERVPVNMTASILYEGEREVATVGILTDLRDRVQLERKLSDAEVRLEESKRNAALMALAGTTAHELNQPLTSVLGFAELLKRKLKTDDDSYKRVDTIFREAERMKEIVKKIGKITRFETKPYLGDAQILDLEKSSEEHEDPSKAGPGRDEPAAEPRVRAGTTPLEPAGLEKK